MNYKNFSSFKRFMGRLAAGSAAGLLIMSGAAFAEPDSSESGTSYAGSGETLTAYSQAPSPETVAKVQKLIEDQIRTRPDMKIGCSIIHIPSGRKASHNGRFQFPLASVFKIPVMLELCAQIQNAELPINLDTQLTVKKEDRCIGSGILCESPIGSKILLDKAIVLMITISDNTATDMLVHLIGSGRLRRFMGDLGLHDNSIFMTNRQAWLICLGEGGLTYSRNAAEIADVWKTLTPAERVAVAAEVEQENLDLSLTEFQNMENRSGATNTFAQNCKVAETVDNMSSPDDFSLMLAKLWNGEILERDWTDYALSVLARQKYNSRIPRYLPKGTQTYHKTGTISGVVNDSGIIISKSGSPVAVTVFCKNVGGHSEEAAQMIGKLSKIAWDNF